MAACALALKEMVCGTPTEAIFQAKFSVRKQRRVFLAIVSAVAGWAVVQLLVAPTGNVVPNREASAFVGLPTTPALRYDHGHANSKIVCNGGNRRQNRYNHVKPLHPRYIEPVVRNFQWFVPPNFLKMGIVPEPNLEKWSQTLKISFPEGEDDVVTEDEVKEYFTDDEHGSPEAVILGHQLPHEKQKVAYVHFSTREATKKARKEKDGGAIGKASEVKLVYVDEKKWIRTRDGVRLSGGKRGGHWKAYGDEMLPEWEDFDMETGSRSHPIYPE